MLLVVLASAALALAAPALAASDPAAGVWLWRIGTGPQGNDYKDIPINVVAAAGGGSFDVEPAAAYQVGNCQFGPGEKLGHFVYRGLDVNKDRRYEGEWLSWSSVSDGTCDKKGLSGPVTASLRHDPLPDSPDLVRGPNNSLSFYLGAYPRLDEGVRDTGDWGLTRKSGTLPSLTFRAAPSPGSRGKPVNLRYTVIAPFTGMTTVERVTVSGGGKAIWSASGKAHTGSAASASYFVRWVAPKKLAGSYAFCVSGQPADGSLGWSKPSCAPIRLR